MCSRAFLLDNIWHFHCPYLFTFCFLFSSNSCSPAEHHKTQTVLMLPTRQKPTMAPSLAARPDSTTYLPPLQSHPPTHAPHSSHECLSPYRMWTLRVATRRPLCPSSFSSRHEPPPQAPSSSSSLALLFTLSPSCPIDLYLLARFAVVVHLG